MVATYHRPMPEPVEPATHLGLPAWGFAFPGPLRDELTALALDGTKIATAGLGVDYVVDGDFPSRPGDREVLLDSDGRPVAIIETTRVELSTIALVSDEFARAEGEGFADARTGGSRTSGSGTATSTTFGPGSATRRSSSPTRPSSCASGSALVERLDGSGLMATRITPADRLTTIGQHAGMERSIAISRPTVGSERLYSSIVSTAPGDKTRIHHHGDCETSIYIVSGTGPLHVGPDRPRARDVGRGRRLRVHPGGRDPRRGERQHDRAARRRPDAELPGFARRVRRWRPRRCRRRARAVLDARWPAGGTARCSTC